MSYEFMNMINNHLEDQRMYEYEDQKLKEISKMEKRERRIHEIALGLVFLAVFLLDTPH